VTVSQYILEVSGTALRADYRPYAFDVVAINLHYTSYIFRVHSSVIAEFAAAVFKHSLLCAKLRLIPL